MPYYDDDYGGEWTAEDEAIMERLARDPGYGRVEYEVSPRAASFIERQVRERLGLEQMLEPSPLLSPYIIPPKISDEETAANAVAATSNVGVPPGYMINSFGQLVKIPKGYVPPTPEGEPGKDISPPGGVVSYTAANGSIMTWDGVDRYQQTGFDPTKIYEPPETPSVVPPPPNGITTYTNADGAIMTWDGTGGKYIQTGFDPTKVYVPPPPPKPGGVSADTAATIEAGQKQHQEMLAWYNQEQQARLEAERQQRLATLRASPASWLEYASLAGTTPGIQPWMLPLMPQQYFGLSAGEPIPGWSPKLETSLSSLPKLTTPSQQYLARMGPSAQAQYGGYEQARTGATPSDIEWRLWSQAPPGGRHSALTYNR